MAAVASWQGVGKPSTILSTVPKQKPDRSKQRASSLLRQKTFGLGYHQDWIILIQRVAMTNFQGSNATLGESEHGVSNGGRITDLEMFRRFLESLSPDQMTMLILSGAYLDQFMEKNINVGEPDLDRSFPLANEHKPFDFEEWKNQPDHRIR